MPPPGHQCPPDPSHLASIWFSVIVVVLLKFKLLVPWDRLRQVTMLLLDHPDSVSFLPNCVAIGSELLPRPHSDAHGSCKDEVEIASMDGNAANINESHLLDCHLEPSFISCIKHTQNTNTLLPNWATSVI